MNGRPEPASRSAMGGPCPESSDVPPRRGLLHRDGSPEPFDVRRFQPSPALADRVECYWITRWDLRGRPPHEQEILPHPSVNVVVQERASGVFGIATAKRTKALAGRHRAVGIKFHPGAFLACPPSDLTDAHLRLEEVFGSEGSNHERLVLATDDNDEIVGLAERFVASQCPAADEDAVAARRIVENIRGDSQLLRVDAVAARHGLSTRGLQRLFERRLGVTPKWVIQRYRLHEAVARIESGGAVRFAALAADLGWVDQAHFVRDFTRIVGRPPGRYAAALRGPAE